MPDDYVAFARERSHRDVESTGEYGRLMVQFVAAANGLAATAILTLIGAFKSETLGLVMAIPLACYMAGSYYALDAAQSFYSSQDKFASMWEQRSYATAEANRLAETLFGEACAIKDNAFRRVRTSLLCFIKGGIIAAVVMTGYFLLTTVTVPMKKHAYSLDCTLTSLHCDLRAK